VDSRLRDSRTSNLSGNHLIGLEINNMGWDNHGSVEISVQSKSTSNLNMLNLEWIWEPKNRTAILLASVAVVAAIAVVDWWTKPYVSLGFLYLFPIMLAAGFVARWSIVFLGIACALLSERFSNLDPADAPLRTSFEALAMVGTGLFISEVLRNRRLRLAAQERLRVLVETSPAAIVTVDDHGFIELANNAAAVLLAPRNGNLIGQPIAAFLPELHHALRWEEGPQFRTSMQCRAHRGNGERFLAEVWFSTYKEGLTPRLAAIIADVTDERSNSADSAPVNSDQQERTSLNNREVEVLKLLVQGMTNKEIAAHLNVSESVVKNTLQQLFAKTEVRTRSQLVRVALERYRDLL
jgi:PAS domain S-box-containing protein